MYVYRFVKPLKTCSGDQDVTHFMVPGGHLNSLIFPRKFGNKETLSDR